MVRVDRVDRTHIEAVRVLPAGAGFRDYVVRHDRPGADPNAGVRLTEEARVDCRWLPRRDEERAGEVLNDCVIDNGVSSPEA